MKRNAFVMHLNPECEAKYRKRYGAVWPELRAELRRAGVSDYSIYLDRKTHTLFIYQILAGDALDGGLPQRKPAKNGVV